MNIARKVASKRGIGKQDSRLDNRDSSYSGSSTGDRGAESRTCVTGIQIRRNRKPASRGPHAGLFFER